MIEKNHFLDGDQTWHDCSFPQGEIFSPLGNGKSCDVIRWRYKSHFRLEKSSESRLYLTPNASSSVCQSLRISARLGMDIHDTHIWSCNWKAQKFWIITRTKSWGQEVKKKAENDLFDTFLSLQGSG